MTILVSEHFITRINSAMHWNICIKIANKFSRYFWNFQLLHKEAFQFYNSHRVSTLRIFSVPETS